MHYKWQTAGNPSNPIIAFLAPSSTVKEEVIKRRIDRLVDLGFCVKFPEYANGNIVAETYNKGAIAVDGQTGAQQIIEAIKNGWDIMPLMGGKGFEVKTPHIVEYFKHHPEHKNKNVRFYGFSNATNASILESHDICSYISTPFIPGKTSKPIHEDLKYVFQNDEVKKYGRNIIYNPENKLADVSKTKHYALNSGVAFDLIEKNNIDLLKVKPGEKWSLGIEGPLQRFARQDRQINYKYVFDKFLAHHQARGTLPQYIEMGAITPNISRNRFEHVRLFHDLETGEVLENSENIKRIVDNKESFQKHLKDVYRNFTNAPDDKKAKMLKGETKVAFFPQLQNLVAKYGSLDNLSLDADDAKLIIAGQNWLMQNQKNRIAEIAKKYNVPLVQNGRFGHHANFGVVNAGDNYVNLKGNKLVLTTVPRQQVKQKSGDELRSQHDYRAENYRKHYQSKYPALTGLLEKLALHNPERNVNEKRQTAFAVVALATILTAGAVLSGFFLPFYAVPLFGIFALNGFMVGANLFAQAKDIEQENKLLEQKRSLDDPSYKKLVAEHKVSEAQKTSLVKIVSSVAAAGVAVVSVFYFPIFMPIIFGSIAVLDLIGASISQVSAGVAKEELKQLERLEERFNYRSLSAEDRSEAQDKLKGKYEEVELPTISTKGKTDLDELFKSSWTENSI